MTLARGTWHILSYVVTVHGVRTLPCVVLVLFLLFYKRLPRAYTSEIRHVNRPCRNPYKRWPERQYNTHQHIHSNLFSLLAL
jgi:hypothetical protein